MRMCEGSKFLAAAFVVLSSGFVAAEARAATREVGPGKTYATPCDAIAAASDGDTIEIDAAGDYAGDVCGIPKNGLTLRGVNGRPKIDAAGQNAQGKGIWVIAGDDTVVENVEFTGAKVVDQNGAGIRQEGTNLTVRGCYFHDNENGILAGNDGASTILIEGSEFANNGIGDGLTHNLYINHVGKLVFQHNYSHASKSGHLLKSRAAETHVLYNRLTQEDGVGSYEVDVPNGGRTFIIGNLIQQGASAENGTIVSYRREGPDPANPSVELFVVNNTFVNERPNGGIFLNIDPNVSEPVVVRNNVFVGPGTVITQANAILGSNFEGDAKLVDQAAFDYRLTPGSPCVDAGEAPGMGGGIDLTPKFHYSHPASFTGRTTVGTIDIGAYELGGEGGSGGAGGSGGGAGGSGGGAGGSGGGAGGSGGSGGSGGGDGGGESGEDGSCGCRVVGAGSDGSVGWIVGIALGLAAVSRKSRQRVEISRR